MLYRSRIGFAFSIIAMLLTGAFGTAAQSASEWHSATTRHFTLIGGAPESDLASEAARLEAFRAAFVRLYPQLKIESGKPTVAVLFKDAAAFESVLPKRADGGMDSGVTGYFLASESQNYIALALDQKRPARSPIIHEFIHLMLDANFGTASLPPWLNEGLAEYFDAMRSADDAALLIGGEDRGHLQLLRRVGLIPVSELVAIDANGLRSMSVDRRRQFYSESWLLVRQLIADGKLKVEDLSQVLEKLKPGGDPLSAAFGIEAATTQTALTKTLAERSPKSATRRVAAATDLSAASATPLASARASAILGDLLFQMGDADRAGGYLRDALASDKNEPLANAVYGKLLVAQNKWTDATPFLKTAVDAGSTDHWVYYDYAFVLSREFLTGEVIGDISDAAANDIRRALQRSLELEPSFVESYRLAALVDLARDENLDEALAFARRALTIKSDDANLKLLLARILLRREDADSARRLAAEVTASADVNQKAEAGEIIRTADEIADARAASKAQNQLSLSVARAMPIAVLKRSWLTDADLEKIETDRVNNNFNRLIIRPRTGEQQVVGHIQRIACNGNDVSYYVNTGSDTVILRSTEFNSVQMTVAQEAGNSYSLDCGAKLDKVLTVINYSPVSTGRGVVTAISFVPDDFRLKSLREMLAARMVAIDDDTLRRGAPPVAVNAESARRSIQNDLRKPRKDETRVLGQIEKIECSGNNWVMQIVADGRHIRFGPPRVGEPSLGWFTVASTQLPLECGGGPLLASAVFAYAKSDTLDGELRAIEFVPDGFTLTTAGR